MVDGEGGHRMARSCLCLYKNELRSHILDTVRTGYHVIYFDS